MGWRDRGLFAVAALCWDPWLAPKPCKQSRVVQSPALVQLEQIEISSGLVLCSWRQRLALNRLMQQGEQLCESSDCTESGDGCGSLSLPVPGWHQGWSVQPVPFCVRGIKLPAGPRHRGRCMLQPRGRKSLSC